MIKINIRYLLLFLCSCSLSPAERWFQATGLTPIATITRQSVVMCNGNKIEACHKSGKIIINYQADDDTILHELGHEFTPYHLITGKSGIMVDKRNNMSRRSCISKNDLELICNQVNCQWKKPEC